MSRKIALLLAGFLILVLGLIRGTQYVQNDEPSQPCIQKQDIIYQGELAQLWLVEGDLYLAKQTPHGDYEMVGLYSRFKN